MKKSSYTDNPNATVRERLGFAVPSEVEEVLSQCPSFVVADHKEQLQDLALRDVNGSDWHEVAYDVPGKGSVVEAKVCRVKNGIAANYLEPYMRRRDPDCMFIGDSEPTNKPTFDKEFPHKFADVRQATFDWMKGQELAVFAFTAGMEGKGTDAMVIAPANAGFFALGLALLQGIMSREAIPEGFSPKAIIYVAPPFRHTHFEGKQVVVHNRLKGMHELFSYNLYPGPSAKKGIYGVLINLGEAENWVTMHCSTVQVVTPYDNKIVISHEGASGGGKSEMLEHVHRARDGSLRLGENLVTGEKRTVTLPQSCELRPVTDDMALCHPSLDKGRGKLTLMDAESAWFVRVNHINHYGIDPNLEDMTIHPKEPLLFLSIDAQPNSTALIWDHIEDSPGKPCPNPRVIVPRNIVPNVIDGAVDVDVRSFGVRTPPCTKEKPSYGIIGMFHILPPALAWLWRLVAPRGHANPSIVDQEGMTSEGVGSYWPFATGRRVDQANLLLNQIIETPAVRYILTPNQHIGAWEVGFMPQWIVREYLARRASAEFSREQVTDARCPLLGYAMKPVMIEGRVIGPWFLEVDKQPEVGEEAYDKGAKILANFFHKELSQFDDPDLLPLGRKIIDCCFANGSIADYEKLIDVNTLIQE
ncbi:MAG: DUF4914 family protein [Opitutales bacterium]|nr:DUF4914 family protein [Opitutales bacterium]